MILPAFSLFFYSAHVFYLDVSCFSGTEIENNCTMICVYCRYLDVEIIQENIMVNNIIMYGYL